MAQYNVGCSYFHGQGVKKDKVDAYMWWLLAASQGLGKAMEDVTSAERKGLLTRAEIAEGKSRADEWTKQHIKTPAGNGSRP